MTPKWLISRRTLLRGAGGTAIALPLLDVMVRPSRLASAQTAPKRLVTWFQPGGTILDRWRPTGTESNFSFGTGATRINEALEPYRSDLVVLDGLDMSVQRASLGHPHYRGLAALWTGHVLLPGTFTQISGPSTGWAQGPSFDQLIAKKIGTTTKFPSLEFGVRWPSMEDGPRPTNVIWYKDKDSPVSGETNPQMIFNRLFTNIGPGTGTGTGGIGGGGLGGRPGGTGGAGGGGVVVDPERRRSRSILDTIAGEYQTLGMKVSVDDRKKLEEHLTSIRELERTIANSPPMVNGLSSPPACAKPDGITAAQDRYNDNVNTPRTGKIMMDMMIMALVCDLTRVVGIQWADPLSRNTFPWLNLNSHHHMYQHDNGYQPEPLTVIYKWYATQFAYFLSRLRETKLMDSTLVVAGSEICHPPTHSLTSIPFMLAGNLGGKVKTNRYLKYNGVSHINLLISVQNLFDMPVTTFGKEGYSTGPLAGLV